MATVPVMFVEEPKLIVIPQIALELQTDGHMARQEMNHTLVMYASFLPFATKGPTCLNFFNMAAPLEWNDKEERICWSRHNLK